MSLNQISYSLPAELEDAVRAEITAWQSDERIARIWQKDASVWTGGEEAKWLGWLDVIERERERVGDYVEFADEVRDAGLTNTLLLGMGGSSLCPEVLAETFEKDNFRILDSTVPAEVAAAERTFDPAATLFIVSSKSGSTLEPNCFKQYFFSRVGEDAGSHFAAITDPGSKMEEVASEDGFRRTFYGEPEVGGRFSALSAFGLLPAAVMGLDPNTILDRASEMVEACRANDPQSNPGALAGLVLGVCHRTGRDKLTILSSSSMRTFGGWLEQLIAESTGKNGKAIIPVDREPITQQGVDNLSTDRVFVYFSMKNEKVAEEQYRLLEEIERSGRPLIRIEIETAYHLAQEFFRWEFATAVAGAILRIDPFDQPDVEAAKVATRRLTEQFESSGTLPEERPFFSAEGISLYTNQSNAAELERVAGERPSIDAFLKAHIARIGEGDYFAALAYVERNEAHYDALQSIRSLVLRSHGVATCSGFGPRFLHSTGQAYKGGPNAGVFLAITAEDEHDIRVPGQQYTFGVVKSAQARGDFQVLLDRGRRALRVHFSGDVEQGLERIATALR